MNVTATDEQSLMHIPVVMVREELTGLPSFALPPGYRLRYYRPGDELRWAEIEISVGSFGDVERALAYFEEEFGPGRDKLAARCLFLEDESGQAVGTTTVWYNECFHGKPYGRIHWVAIRPEHQGRKLAKPLMAAAMERLAELHERAYLTTQTTSARAIRMYLDFGFVPFVTSDRRRRGWRLLASVLEHPALDS